MSTVVQLTNKHWPRSYTDPVDFLIPEFTNSDQNVTKMLTLPKNNHAKIAWMPCTLIWTICKTHATCRSWSVLMSPCVNWLSVQSCTGLSFTATAVIAAVHTSHSSNRRWSGLHSDCRQASSRCTTCWKSHHCHVSLTLLSLHSTLSDPTTCVAMVTATQSTYVTAQLPFVTGVVRSRQCDTFHTGVLCSCPSQQVSLKGRCYT